MSAASQEPTATEAADLARQRRRNDPDWQQKIREREIARKYSGRFESRLVFEAIWGIAGFITMTGLAVAGQVPWLVTCLVNSVLSYCLYMPLHEATHNNIQGRHWNLRWLNDLVGILCSPFVGFSFKAHQLSHMRHHAYTNDPERDPDYYVKGSVLQVPKKVMQISILQLVAPAISLLPESIRPTPDPAKQPANIPTLGNKLDPEEMEYSRRYGLMLIAAFMVTLVTGHFWQFLVLCYLPTRFGVIIMMALFAWLPHHPHSERGRYRDTRVTLFPGSKKLIRGHDRHIIHHMHPLIPHYRIPPAFAEMRPMLEERGARIEGPLAGPDAPKILLRNEG